MLFSLDPTRREFLASLAAFSLFPLDSETPDLILFNAKIFTVDNSKPRAEVVAISNGRFIAVGSNTDVLPLGTALTMKLDLAGKTVLPGFNDAHHHSAESGLDMVVSVDCDLPSIAAIQAALRERTAKTPPVQWIFGSKYDDTKGAEGRMLRSLIAGKLADPVVLGRDPFREDPPILVSVPLERTMLGGR